MASEEQSQNAVHQAPRWCLWLGMTAAAWDGWGKMHVKPHVAACYYFSAVAATLTTASVQLTDMTDFRPLYLGVCTFPFVGFMVTNVLNNVVFWRHGPVLAHHKLYTAVLLLGVCLLLPSGLLGYVGPIEAVPFHNRFYFICIAIAGTVCASHILAAGGSKAEHPLQPRTSILQPFVRGTIHAAQLMDAVTDLGVIGDLMEQVCPLKSGCYLAFCSQQRSIPFIGPLNTKFWVYKQASTSQMHQR